MINPNVTERTWLNMVVGYHVGAQVRQTQVTFAGLAATLFEFAANRTHYEVQATGPGYALTLFVHNGEVYTAAGKRIGLKKSNRKLQEQLKKLGARQCT